MDWEIDSGQTQVQQKNQRTDSPKSLLACKVLMECCVSSMQTQYMQRRYYTIRWSSMEYINHLGIVLPEKKTFFKNSIKCTSSEDCIWVE